MSTTTASSAARNTRANIFTALFCAGLLLSGAAVGAVYSDASTEIPVGVGTMTVNPSSGMVGEPSIINGTVSGSGGEISTPPAP